jgi:thiol-disulfide isomerase/thioredoxin
MVAARYLLPLVGALALASCGPAPGYAPAVAPAPPAPRAAAHPSYALLAGARTFAGRSVEFASADRPVTVAVLFASWCDECRAELAILADLVVREPRLRVVGINAFEEYQERSSQDRLHRFLSNEVPWLDAILADDALLRALGSPTSVPMVYVFDAAGSLVAVFGGGAHPVPERDEIVAAARAAGA